MGVGIATWPPSPALVLAAALAAGIGWADGRPPVPVAVAAALAAGVGTLILLWPRRLALRPVAPIARLVVACILVASAGALRFGNTIARPPAPGEVVHPAAGHELDLTGYVVSATRTNSGRQRLLVEGAFTRGCRREPCLILVYTDGDERVPVGSSVALRAVALPWPSARNPGEFDYGRYLSRRGVSATVRSRGSIRVTMPASTLRRMATALRNHVERSLSQYVPSDEARAVLRALVLGDRSLIGSTVQESFISTGLAHLLAVSGLHVMIIGLVLYRVAGPVLLRAGFTWGSAEAVRTGTTLGVLALYAVLTGLPTSVIRAVTMTGVFLVGPVFRRRTHSLNSLGVASLIILWVQPFSLYDAGFQLSFSAVAGIILLTPSLQQIARRHGAGRFLPESVISGTIVSTAATVATLPVLLAHFGRASLAGVFLNVAAIPLTALALSAIMLCLLLSPAPVLAAAFGAAADIGIRILIALASQGESLLSILSLDSSPDPAGYALLLTIAATFWAASRPRLIWRTVVVGAVVFSLLRLRAHAARAMLEVVFFDVGQGDAALIQTPGRRTMLVDAGPRTDRFDAGHRVLLPYLSRRGVEHVDTVVLTHAHADHIGGIVSVLREVSVGSVLLADTTQQSTMMRSVARTADSAGVPVRIIAPGDTIDLGPDVRVFVLAPSHELLASADENDRSAILRLEYGRTSLLLMGDAEELAEWDLLSRYRPMVAADVVKVAHHGSSTSSYPFFVAASAPVDGQDAWAVVSVGRWNSYGLPSSLVLQRWQGGGRHLVSTAAEGAILLTSDGTAFRRRHWRVSPLTDSETSGVGNP